MTDIFLGINTGFALNRYPEPEEWIRVVSEELGLKRVQMTADFLNPALPDSIVKEEIRKIKSLCSRYHVAIEHTFTGAFTRVNHFSHPNPKIRRYWIQWFHKFIDLSAALGARSVGSHFSILSVRDVHDPKRRAERFKDAVACWQNIAAYGKKKGLEFVSWEPMSIPREYGETLAETRRIQAAVNKGSALPVRLCLDVDHGALTSGDPRDTDPYEWIRQFGSQSPIIQIKQSSIDKGGHWPFTPERNREGKIQPEKLIQAIQQSGLKEVLLLLELSFREREPAESRVLPDLKASVEFWRPYVQL